MMQKHLINIYIIICLKINDAVEQRDNTVNDAETPDKYIYIINTAK